MKNKKPHESVIFDWLENEDAIAEGEHVSELDSHTSGSDESASGEDA